MGMDGDFRPGPFVGMHIGIGITTGEIDQKYASRTSLKRPPVELDLFPADAGSPDLRPSCRTLPWEKSSTMIDDGGDRSAGEGKAGIHPVPASRGFSVNKLPASCHCSEAAGAIDVSPSSNNTLYSNAINEESGYGMNSKRKWVAADDGGDRSTGEEKAGIHPVPVSRGFSVNKLPASCHYSEATGAIDVSPSSNNTLYSNAINEESGYGMNLKRKWAAAEELKNNRACSRTLSDVEEEGGAKINKIRLSKEQCALLEESFSKNKSPELKQRHALAMQTNLHPRQVDVWFQNRRARTKLKQTEMDCEVLKRCNDSLEDENRRLQKELQEFRVLKLESRFTVTMCASCEKVAASNNTAAFTLEKVRRFTEMIHSICKML